MRYRLEYALAWIFLKFIGALPRPLARAVGISLEVGIRCRAEGTALHAGDGWPIPGVDPRALGPDDYASPEKRLFFMMACTPQLPSTTCVMP